MPQGPGTYGSKRGRPKVKNAFRKIKKRIKRKIRTHNVGDQNQGQGGTTYNDISGSGE